MNKHDKQGNRDWAMRKEEDEGVCLLSNNRAQGDLEHCKCTAFVQCCKAFHSSLQPNLAPWTLEKEENVAAIYVCISIAILLAIGDTAQHTN